MPNRGRNALTAVLRRDDAEIGLVVKSDHKPHEAGPLAFDVDDLDALHHELAERGGEPGEFDIEDWGGKQFRTFFMREDMNGYCYCFYCPLRVIHGAAFGLRQWSNASPSLASRQRNRRTIHLRGRPRFEIPMRISSPCCVSKCDHAAQAFTGQ